MLIGNDSVLIDDEFYVCLCQLCLVGFDPCTSAISAVVSARLYRSDLNALVLSDTKNTFLIYFCHTFVRVGWLLW
jgi:hypothetical protein